MPMSFSKLNNHDNLASKLLSNFNTPGSQVVFTHGILDQRKNNDQIWIKQEKREREREKDHLTG